MHKNTKEQSEREALTTSEWRELRRVLDVSLFCFAGTVSECGVLHYLLKKTIGFSKFSDVLTPGHFRGEHDYFPSLARASSRTLERVRERLVAANVIEATWIRKGFVIMGMYRLNVPGMLRALLRVGAAPEALSVLAIKVEKAWKRENYKGGEVKMGKTISEQYEKALAKNKQAREKRSAKKKSKDLSVIWILDEMKEYCKELGIHLHDVWTAKDYGCAKNWLGYCARDGRDPRKVLYEVCKLWPYFKRGALFNDTGKGITLPDTVSFSKYFIYRREIGSWIEANRDRPSRLQIGEIKVINLNERRGLHDRT